MLTFLVIYFIISTILVIAAVIGNIRYEIDHPWSVIPVQDHLLFATLTFFIWPVVFVYGFWQAIKDRVDL